MRPVYHDGLTPDTEPVLTQGELLEIMASFGLGTDPTLDPVPSRGEQGQVWRLDSSTGTWAVKELFISQTEDDMHVSADFQQTALRAGIPAPGVVRTRDGHVLLELSGRQFRIFTWADILPANANLDPREVGLLVAGIHRLGYPSNGPVHAWYIEPVGAQRWQQLIRALTERGAATAERLGELEDELCSLEGLLLEMPSDLQQLHLDLWADNVRATRTGDLCVIDWDNCGPGDPRQELAAMLFEYGLGSSARARALYGAYVEAGGPGRLSRPADFSMVVAQLGHILEMQCQNWLSATTAQQRDRAEVAIEEFLARPLTRALIDEILSAIA